MRTFIQRRLQTDGQQGGRTHWLASSALGGRGRGFNQSEREAAAAEHDEENYERVEKNDKDEKEADGKDEHYDYNIS